MMTQRQRKPPRVHQAGRWVLARARREGCIQVPKIKCSSRANMRVTVELRAGRSRRSRRQDRVRVNIGFVALGGWDVGLEMMLCV